MIDQPSSSPIKNISYDKQQEENDHTINSVEHVPPPPPRRKVPSKYHNQPEPKPNLKNVRDLTILFDDFDIFHSSDGPLYIVIRIAKYSF